MPKLIRLYITHVAIGFAIAAAFVGMLLWFDIANLWHLVTHSDKGLLAVVILWFANGIVFAGVQFAIAVMRLKDDGDDGPRGGHRQRVMHREYATVPARANERDARAFWQKKR
ncbi:hypothetical protein RA2_01298 [Roseovarius sp. A-2]|uniref:hypothetical protein n=1 Tax=Roseovarius sp. A-2 TaxID=1570360 RepID=UPI0009B5456A|nr:hypothetical protein [Roseovarius sp. A-2]GAW34253.1 hypothetical protein RA2_01298 [Roseovarius sp. A-2]